MALWWKVAQPSRQHQTQGPRPGCTGQNCPQEAHPSSRVEPCVPGDNGARHRWRQPTCSADLVSFAGPRTTPFALYDALCSPETHDSACASRGARGMAFQEILRWFAYVPNAQGTAATKMRIISLALLTAPALAFVAPAARVSR